jgi:hypothetical protein
VDTSLDRQAKKLREHFDSVSMLQLRATQPEMVAEHRRSVLGLLHLLLEDEAKIVSRIPSLEYLFTLLSTAIGEDGYRQLAHDPVSLTRTVEKFCNSQETKCSGDSHVSALEIHRAANELDAAPDLAELARIMRGRKREFGAACFAPDVLRAIVTFNTRLGNLLKDQRAKYGGKDEDFSGWLDDEARAKLSAEFVGQQSSDGESGAQPDAPSVYEVDSLQRILDALRRRLAGIPIGSSDSERVAIALDLSRLDAHEQTALEETERDLSQRATVYALLIGALNAALPMLSEPLAGLQLSPRFIRGPWLAQVDDDLQTHVRKLISSGSYDEACRVTETKTRFLHPALAGKVRDKPHKRKAVTDQAPRSSDREIREMTREALLDTRGGQAAKRPRRVISKPTDAGRSRRTTVLQVVAGVLVAGLAVNVLFLQPEIEVVDLSTRQLTSLSEHLESAYRDGHGRGPMIIGRVRSSWHALGAKQKRESALAIVDNVVLLGVKRVVVYDENQRMVIQYAGGELRRPKAVRKKPRRG